MSSAMNWLSKILESMGNAFIRPINNDLSPSIEVNAYSIVTLKRKMRISFNYALIGMRLSFLLSQIIYLKHFGKSLNLRTFA